ncbi:MAG: chromosomal replication initiator protein DnaA [Candidatus Omnitrophica bacterium]|nr:chromosomal replication initiator protein DnaA [Candidatus Omnitrophota bacterium]
MDSLWKKALNILRSEVNEQIFSAWFQPITQVSFDSSSLTLGVPNKFYEDWLKEKYISLISTAVHQAAGKDVSVSFKIVDTPNMSGMGQDPAPSVDPPEKTAPKPSSEERTPSGRSWLKNVFSPQPLKNSSSRAELNDKYTFDEFVVGPSNRFAHAAAMAVCENIAKQYNPFFLYGGTGLGKTHLMQAMGHEIMKRHPRARVIYLSSEEFTNQLINGIRNKTMQKFRDMYRHADILLLDDIQFISGKESTQEEFFHTFNTLYDAHKQIVLCSDRPPKEIAKLEERLVTRFAWGLTADVQPPDFETRIAILERKSQNEAVAVSKEVLFFLAEHIRSNIRELEGALIRVAAYGKLTGREMTTDLAREVLKGMISEGVKKIHIKDIQNTVSDFFGVPETDLKSKKRTRAIAYPRQIAMYLAREFTDHSLPDIGNFFGRDHTTVLHACDKIAKEVEENEKTRDTIKRLRSMIKD